MILMITIIEETHRMEMEQNRQLHGSQRERNEAAKEPLSSASLPLVTAVQHQEVAPPGAAGSLSTTIRPKGGRDQGASGFLDGLNVGSNCTE